jgi:hypothetical protein
MQRGLFRYDVTACETKVWWYFDSLFLFWILCIFVLCFLRMICLDILWFFVLWIVLFDDALMGVLWFFDVCIVLFGICIYRFTLKSNLCSLYLDFWCVFVVTRNFGIGDSGWVWFHCSA